jgi:hypothetical protein
LTAADFGRWSAALRRLSAGYDRKMPPDQVQAWYDQLERYPMDAVEQALRDAPAEAGRFFPTVGLVEQLVKKHMAGTPRSTGDWHAPDIHRNEDGVVVARWRCVFCEDTGWRAKLTDTGQLLTHDELIRRREALRVPREDGEPSYRMARCACRTPGQQAEQGAA